MTVKIHNYTVDARDAYTQSVWWTQVVGWQQDPDDPNEPDHTQCWIGPSDGTPGLLFVTVPEGRFSEPRTGPRMHFDVQPTDCSRDEEVERLKSLGATEYEDHRRADGSGWVTMADPEGNLFCVERSAAERV